MTKLLFLAVLSLLAPAGFACAASPVPAQGHPDTAAEGWTPLFADDLSNAIAPDPKAWVLEAPGSWRSDIDRMLFTKATYENFVLDAEFKNASGTNSGLILYCSDPGNWVPNSIEVQIADDFDPKWSKSGYTSCCAFYGRQPASKHLVKKPGEWNHCTVVCIGKEVQVRLNGETVNQFDLARFTDAKKNPDGSTAPPWLSKPPAGLPAKGHIGLQGKHGAASVWWRNLKIRQLSAEDAKAVRASWPAATEAAAK